MSDTDWTLVAEHGVEVTSTGRVRRDGVELRVLHLGGQAVVMLGRTPVAVAVLLRAGFPKPEKAPSLAETFERRAGEERGGMGGTVGRMAERDEAPVKVVSGGGAPKVVPAPVPGPTPAPAKSAAKTLSSLAKKPTRKKG